MSPVVPCRWGTTLRMVRGVGMGVPQVPSISHRYEDRSLVTDRARARTRSKIRCATALLVYSTSYPLLGFALWTGARDGGWLRASIFVALGVFMSLLGWWLLSSIGQPTERSTARENGNGPIDVTVFLALYNRTGAIVVLLESYTVAAISQGWPTPHTFIGWFALAWIPLLAAFCVPIKRFSIGGDVNE